MRKKMIVIILCCFLSYIYLLTQVLSNQNAYEPKPADCILILGHSLEDGRLPGNYLIERLTAGIELYQNGYAPVIIVSGGKGPNDTIPVAHSMMDWLVNKGINKEAIYIEENAHNTYENFLYTKAYANENEIDSVIVVTNDFHIYRSMMIAKDHFNNVSARSAQVDFSQEKLRAYLKEPFSVIKYLLTKGLYQNLHSKS